MYGIKQMSFYCLLIVSPGLEKLTDSLPSITNVCEMRSLTVSTSSKACPPAGSDPCLYVMQL